MQMSSKRSDTTTVPEEGPPPRPLFNVYIADPAARVYKGVPKKYPVWSQTPSVSVGQWS